MVEKREDISSDDVCTPLIKLTVPADDPAPSPAHVNAAELLSTVEPD